MAAAATGEGDSPTSGPAASEIEARRDKEILDEWHRHPGLGPSQIRNQLRRAGVKVSVHTARRVMAEAGYRPPKVKRHPHDERYEVLQTGRAPEPVLAPDWPSHGFCTATSTSPRCSRS